MVRGNAWAGHPRWFREVERLEGSVGGGGSVNIHVVRIHVVRAGGVLRGRSAVVGSERLVAQVPVGWVSVRTGGRVSGGCAGRGGDCRVVG